MISVIVPLLLSTIVGIIEYWSKTFNLRKKSYYRKIVSFSAGISITYILLELLPAFSETSLAVSKFLFISLLIGFISHHVVEKEIYKHNKTDY